MDATEAQAALQKISEVAKLAGIRGQVDDKGRFSATFTITDKRTHVVYVRPTLKMPAGIVVTIYAPCLLVKDGFLSGFSKEDALELLKTNENIPFARYSLMAGNGDEMIVMAGLDALLDTLDAVEFNTYVWAVASYADAYEAKHEGKSRPDAF